jgi:hypothetical protein
MAVLQIAFDAFWAEFSLIKRELIPGLYADYLIVFDFELHTTLLAAEAAMGLDKLVRLDACIELRALSIGQVGKASALC